jgi:hypothetical protein
VSSRLITAFTSPSLASTPFLKRNLLTLKFKLKINFSFIFFNLLFVR